MDMNKALATSGSRVGFTCRLLVTCLLMSQPVHAATKITIAGYTFDDNAFADVLLESVGSFAASTQGTLGSVLTDMDVATYAYPQYSSVASVLLGFTDNYIVNGAGPDLALFELGSIESFQVTIGTISKIYQSVRTQYLANDYPLNVVLVDLADFNIPEGQGAGAAGAAYAVGSGIGTGVLVVGGGLGVSLVGAIANDGDPSLSLVGALNSAPVPGPTSIILLGSGLIGLAGTRRKLKN